MQQPMNSRNFNQWERGLVTGTLCQVFIYTAAWTPVSWHDEDIWRPLSWHVPDTETKGRKTKRERQREEVSWYLYAIHNFTRTCLFIHIHSFIHLCSFIHHYSLLQYHFSRIRDKNRDTTADGSSLRFVCLVFTAPNNRQNVVLYVTKYA